MNTILVVALIWYAIGMCTMVIVFYHDGYFDIDSLIKGVFLSALGPIVFGLLISVIYTECGFKNKVVWKRKEKYHER